VSAPYVCPECRGPLAPSPSSLSCAACGIAYPVDAGRRLYLPAAAFLWSTRLPGLRPLAGSPLNPYLVLAIDRRR
jgi:hypothetical protein